MNQFKKLALASAVAALPMSGVAMEAMEDEALSAVTGQDGVTITIGSTSIGGVRIDDNNGFTGGDGNGAIFISGVSVSGATTIVVDADSDTIQAAVSLAAGTLGLGAVSATATGATSGGTTLINMGSLVHTGITLNAQLGDEDQGHMVVLSGTVTSGISITGFSISDTDSLGSISADLSITDTGASNLTLRGNINSTAGGLTIGNLTGSTAQGWDITLGSLSLGGTAIGDVSIVDLDLGTITITGH